MTTYEYFIIHMMMIGPGRKDARTAEDTFCQGNLSTRHLLEIDFHSPSTTFQTQNDRRHIISDRSLMRFNGLSEADSVPINNTNISDKEGLACTIKT